MEFHVLTDPAPELVLGGTTGTVVPLNHVNWDREVALVADLGEQRTGGYSVRFRDVRTVGSTVEASLEVVRPGHGAMLIQIITRPFAVTTVVRSALPRGPFTVRFTDAGGAELGRVQAAL